MPGSSHGARGADRPPRPTKKAKVGRCGTKLHGVIFKAVGEGRPYPEHRFSSRDWANVPPRQVRLDQLITTKAILDLNSLLAEDSTFYGDLFPHVVQWRGQLYLEDGLHRALRAALHQRLVLHARVLDMDEGTAQ
ncbi:hypothetical protein GCM10023195_80170 [Actinoallomurus liliacearum]|uniref:Antitoxin VapB n=1 Tax=Actinoallomurus liliacearum TaxID=1080073 RepID=A0ABP8TXW7_9ACTN